MSNYALSTAGSTPYSRERSSDGHLVEPSVPHGMDVVGIARVTWRWKKMGG